MKFDPQIVAQANEFVNALRSGQRAHVPLCAWNTGSSSWSRYTLASVWRDMKPVAP
jgi:hypothetical protein